MNITRPNQVTFRLSNEEHRSFKDKVAASGKTQQEYLRRTALNKNIINMSALKEIIPEMKRQGNNLNQIAKRLNARRYVDYDGMLAETLKEVQDTWQLLRQYLHTLP